MQDSKKFYRTVIILLIILIGVLFHLYQNQIWQTDILRSTTQKLLKETQALKLKTQLLLDKSKQAKAWSTLKEDTSSPVPTNIQNKTENTDESNLKTKTTKELAETLEANVKAVEKSDLEKLNDAIAVANETIEREPESYSAYKAKLILLLTKEAKFSQEIDDEEVTNLLETMASFDILSDKTLHKEAFLISQASTQIETLEDEIDELEEIIDAEEYESDSELVKLEEQIQTKLDSIEDLEDDIQDGLLEDEDYLNEDIIEIPMRRALAKEHYEEVMTEAEALLDDFPDSVTGYFFLIRALELSGQKENALDVIADSQLSKDKTDDLNNRLRRAERQNPKDYWKLLRF